MKMKKYGFQLLVVALTLLGCLSASADMVVNEVISCGNGTQPTEPCTPEEKCTKSCPCGTSDPVNCDHADEYRTVRDLQVWGSVGDAPLEWTRWAHTRTTPGRQWFGQGHNWRHNYQWELSYWPGSPDQVELNYPDGNQYFFTKASATQWNSQAACSDILNQNGDDLYLQRQNGWVYHFSKHTDPYGYIFYLMTDFCDTKGNTTTLTYDSSNRLMTVTEPGGRSLTIQYANLSMVCKASGFLSYILNTPTANQWNEIDVSWNTSASRYVTYTGPDYGHCDVSEIQFLDKNGNVLTGTPFGTGPAAASNTDYTKAFDGDVSTYVDMADSSGGYVGLDLGANNTAAVSKIRFYPRPGYESRMEEVNWADFGTFGISSIFPASVTVISEVDCSDGRKVVYNYTPYYDNVLPYNYQVLSSVTYDDGTQANYTYTQVIPSTPPLVTVFDDPRYSLGSLNKAQVSYYPMTMIAGAVHTEMGADGSVIATVGIQGTSIEIPTLTYGDGSVDSYIVNNGYVPFGMVSNHIDTLGRNTSYGYDSNSFQSSVTDPLGLTTGYVKSTHNNTLQTTYPDGSTESWTRDSLDLPLTHTDQLGRVTTWTRDSFHRVTRIDYPDSTYETFTYNNFGEVLAHRLQNGGVVTNTYGSTGLLLTTTDPLSNTTTYTYDSYSRLASVTDALGRTTSYQYNLRGLITQVTYADGSTQSATYDNYANKLTTTDALGHTTAYAYDQFNRNISVTDPLGRTTLISYGLLGGSGCSSCHIDTHISRITLPSGKITTFTYDTEWNQLTQTVGYGTSDAATTTNAYDNDNRLISVTDPLSHISQYFYDSVGNKIMQIDPLGFDTWYGYDLVGNNTWSMRPDGLVFSSTYDSMNRLHSTISPNYGATTTYAYDAMGHLATLTDAKSQSTAWQYDLDGRNTQKTYADGTHENYVYNSVNNLTSWQRTDGVTATYAYDNRNRLITTVWSDSTPGDSRTYDATGKVLTLNNSQSSLTYAYDNANELLSETQQPSGQSAYTVSYAYDVDGNRASLTYPDGTAVGYGYSNRNQVTGISQNGTALAAYSYDLAGKRVGKSLANGTTAAYTYDVNSRLTTLNNQKSGTSFARNDYGYDYVGRQTFQSLNQGPWDTYNYNADDEVTAVNYGSSGRNVTYALDLVGNRTSVTDNGTTTSYTANNLNQYTAVSGNTISYDGRGNLSNWNTVAGYQYDAKNRLTLAVVSGHNVQNSYDARNRVVARTIDGVTKYFVWDGWSLIAEYSSGTLQKKYINGAFIDEILVKINGGTVYYHYNALGSTIALTDGNGNVIEKYTYDIYGKPSFYDGSGNALTATAYGNRFLFTGREYLSEVTLYDYRNRYYSADLGRWLQRDPIGIRGGLNLYAYCSDDPIGNIDSSGLWATGKVGQAAARGLAKAAGAEVAGLGPEDPGADIAALLLLAYEIEQALNNEPQNLDDCIDRCKKERDKCPDKAGKNNDKEYRACVVKCMKQFPPNDPRYKEPKQGPKKTQKGWEDKSGSDWQPTDHNGTHDPHYDVQHPGGGYSPTYPGR